MDREAGLTALELLISLAIVALLIGIGVPSFGEMATRQRLTGASNGLLNAIHLARGEAIKRNARTTICKSMDGVSCTGDGGWDQGWIVFVDRNGDAYRQIDEEIVAGEGTAPEGVAITGNQPVRRYISYIPRGLSRTVGGGLQMGTVTVCAGDNSRRIVISATGRPRMEEGGAC